MIYITGDTHGNFRRLFEGEYNELTEKDHLIICGDFGGIWERGTRQETILNYLSTLPFKILFADGNHENFELLKEYMNIVWGNGKVGYIRSNVYHLLRGEIYDIEGKSFFVMGGAASHDIENGVLDPEDPEYSYKSHRLREEGKFFRVKNRSWWEEELPSEKEIERAWNNLCEYDKKVDYIITHCAPTDIQKKIAKKLHNNTYKPDRLTDFHQRVYDECEFVGWYCGHYHRNMQVKRINVLYEDLIEI